MKVIRVPWIRCHADEIGTHRYEMEWRKRAFVVVAHSEREARDWWSALCESERNERLGLAGDENTDQQSLF